MLLPVTTHFVASTMGYRMINYWIWGYPFFQANPDDEDALGAAY